MKSVHSVAAIGECMLELSLAPSIFGDARLGVAGDTLNTAIYLHRAARGALAVSYVTALGAESLSDRMLEQLRADGLDISLIERRAGLAPGLYGVITDEKGERSFVYWRSASAARTLLSTGAEALIARLNALDAWFFSAISLAILSPAQRDVLLIAAQEFRRAGGVVAFDSNYRPNLWESKAAAQEAVMRAWSTADIALPSVDDEMALFGDRDENAVVERLAGAGVRFGALKRGANGPRPIGWEIAEGAFAPAETVIDTTAAGDSFNGGFLAGLFCGATPAGAAIAGHALACKVIAHKGAIIPSGRM